MLEQNDRKATPEQAPAPQVIGPATPKKTEPLAVDELRDEFLRNAPEVVDALRRKGKGQEAAQLEQAAKLIGVAVGTQPQQPTQADALKGESVSSVLKNIWDVIDKDPELRKMPQAQGLRRSGKALDDAGLLNITLRNGVVVSFVGNFVENFSLAQRAAPAPAEKKDAPQVKESPASAARAMATPTVVTERPASLLNSESMQKAKELFEQRNHEVTQHTIPGTGFTKADLPVELLSKMGVQVDELERSGQLAKLLKGEKTDLISSFTLRGEQGEPIPFAAKLVLRRDAAGAPSLQFDLPKHTLVIPQQILGKDITPVMKEQLATTGVVPLAEGFRDGQGKTFAAYVAVDKEMNRVVAVRREGIELPKEVLGVKLSPQQNKQLLDGYPTRVEGMTNAKNQVFDAVVQLDPIKRQLTFRDAQPQQKQEEKQQAPRAKVRL